MKMFILFLILIFNLFIKRFKLSVFLYYMDDLSKNILFSIGIDMSNEQFLSNLYPRELFLSEESYNKIKNDVPKLKLVLSSCYYTSIHNNALNKQKWPLINLVRQILSQYNYHLEPVRKANGYIDGKKMYKRYFKITKKSTNI